MANESEKLVTLGGECFEAAFQSKEIVSNRDGVFYLFRLKDLVKGRGDRLVSLFRFGPHELDIPDYDSRIEVVRLNALRRAFDSAAISFDTPYDEHTYRELSLRPEDFKATPVASDAEIRQFIMHEAYWLSWRYGSRYPVQFDSPADLDYLGVESDAVRRNAWLLGEKGLLEKSKIPGIGRPTALLVEMYESRQSMELPNERVFPPGTQYEAFKVVSGILQSAKSEILIADNYLNDEVLDMLMAVPSQPAMKLLTFKARADFKIAARRFRNQFGHSVEVRVHHAEIHDRAIVIDDAQFYALGASIKDMGGKLSLLNKLEDLTSIKQLRAELQGIWASAVPLL